MDARRSTIRPAVLRAVGAAVVAASLAAACADAGDTPMQAPAPAATAHFTGEQVFRGLVFAEGPVAQRIPELTGPTRAEEADLNEEQRAAVAKWRGELVADMRTLDPGFFGRFGEAMQSGEHLRITAAMDESADLFRRVVQQRGATGARRVGSDTGGEEPDAGTGTGACVTLYVVGNVAAVVNLAVNWNVAYVANAVYDSNWFWPTKAASTVLAREQAVQLIADRL